MFGIRDIHHTLIVLHNIFVLRYVQSWIDGREIRSERANLLILFERYIPTCLETLRSRFKKITPVTDTSMIQTLCYLLEALLIPDNTPPDTTKEVYELYFVFAAIWAFGGSMFQDQVHGFIIFLQLQTVTVCCTVMCLECFMPFTCLAG